MIWGVRLPETRWVEQGKEKKATASDTTLFKRRRFRRSLSACRLPFFHLFFFGSETFPVYPKPKFKIFTCFGPLARLQHKSMPIVQSRWNLRTKGLQSRVSTFNTTVSRDCMTQVLVFFFFFFFFCFLLLPQVFYISVTSRILFSWDLYPLCTEGLFLCWVGYALCVAAGFKMVRLQASSHYLTSSTISLYVKEARRGHAYGY